MHEGLLIAGNALALVAAWMTARAFFPATGPDERVIATLVGWAVVVLPSLTVLGLLGQLHIGAVLAVFALLAAVAVALAWKRPELVAQGVAPADAPATPRAVSGAFIGLVAGVSIPVIERLVTEPWVPHWDDFSYHAPMAAHWLQAQRLVLAPANYHAYYPGNAELLSAWFMLPSKLDAFATLTGLYGMCLAAVVAAALARALGAGLTGMLTSAALVLATKPFVHQATAFAAVDLIGAALSGAALVFALHTERDAPQAHTFSRVLYAGCAAGLATGAKITFAPVGVVACLIILVRSRVALRWSAALVGCFVLAALACGGYFYVRNWILSGNPLFPAKLAFFDGPLDSVERTPTTLLYQLQHVSSTVLEKAIGQMLDWPTALGCALVLGYLGSLLALRPSQLRTPFGWRTVAVLLTGWMCLAVAVTGPFSGTANDRYADLQIRLRFFLAFALLAAPLLTSVLHRERWLRPWAMYLLAAVIALSAPTHSTTLALCIALGALALHFLPASLPKLAALRPALALGACFVVPAALVLAISLVKLPGQERVMRKQSSAWNVTDKVPDGARLTWFSTFERYKYYRAFGHGLRLVPVPVEEDGRRYTFLHEQLRDARPALAQGAPNPEPFEWRRQNKRPHSWDDPMKRSFDLERLVENLVAQRIEYVVIMRRHKGDWPKQLEVLDGEQAVTRLVKSRNFALYRLDGQRGRSAP